MVLANLNNVADILWEGPGGALAVSDLTATDHISQLSHVVAMLVAPDPITNFSSFLGQEAKIALMVGKELKEKRYYSGIITEMRQAGTTHSGEETADDKGYQYEIHIQPKLWLLSKTFRSRIFQQMTVKNIVSQILSEHKIHHKWKLKDEPQPNEYCVQYKESDLDFVNRLLEYEGIYHYYDHEQATVALGNYQGAHNPCKPFPETYYAEGDMHERNRAGTGFVRRMFYGERVGSGSFESHDYNYEKALTRLSDAFTSSAKTANPALAQYHHNAGHAKHEKAQSKRQAKLRAEAEAASLRVVEGEANSRHLTCGFTFDLKEHYVDSLNQSYLLLGTTSSMEQGRFFTRFKAVPMDAPYRPPRLTPVPRVDGIQTATVTGPSGSKVYLDAMGRAKLQFHWDREGGNSDKSSMFVRVSNGYAGKDYGIQWIPRVGNEVLVQFVDGDPDRPVIIGRVYNDANTNPLGPDEKFQNIIKTIKDNHILFDDKDDAERIEIRAEKDYDTVVVNNKNTEVGNDESTKVKQHKALEVDGNFKQTIGGKKTTTIDSKYEVKSKSGAIEMTADSGGLKLKSGPSTVEITPTKISLKYGGNTVELGPAGVTIKGMLVRIN